MQWIAILSTLATLAAAHPFQKAKIIDQRQVQNEYDYIVVGSGTAGSAIANRLSELEDATVLVIEAGPLDQDEDIIRIPRNAGQAMGTQYDWKYRTVASSTINNRAITVPAGKVVGGGTVLNGMAFDRGAASDYDAWVELGNEGWGWSDLLPWFKKSETFTPPEEPFATEYNITYDPAVHGTDGPVFASYPRFFNPITKTWFAALNAMGIQTERDGASGRAVNAFWAPNALHPTDMERSYAKESYFLPAEPRENFHVLLNNQALKLVGEGSPVRINSVQYATAQGEDVQTVSARREVIVSAGAIGSPKLLQVSGIGPRAHLENVGVDVLVDLPGVGSNYQDHSWVNMFNILQNQPQQPQIPEAQARDMYETNKTGPWTTSGPTSFAFVPLAKLTNDTTRTEQLLSTIDAQEPAQYLRTGTPQAVVDGYAAQKEILHQRLGTNDMALVEVIFQGGGALLSAAHPLSRGYVEINSTDPWAYPVLDFRYGSNPVDFDFVSDSVRFMRRALQQPGLSELRPMELVPGTGQTTDAQLRTWQQGQLSTMYHSCCTNPMQPEELGGVVDSDARVFGTENLRVVDASIMPLIPGTHLQSTVYAIAEKIADNIKASA